MKKILIVLLRDIGGGPRAWRQITALRGGYAVALVGTRSPGVEGVGFYRAGLKPPNLLRDLRGAVFYKLGVFEGNYWDTYNFEELAGGLSKEKFDLVVANEINSLPFALRVADGAKAVFDAYEYYPGQFAN